MWEDMGEGINTPGFSVVFLLIMSIDYLKTYLNKDLYHFIDVETNWDRLKINASFSLFFSKNGPINAGPY